MAWWTKIEVAKIPKFPANTLYLSYLIPSNVTPPPENKHAPTGRLFYGSVGRMRTPVRQQVDLTSATQSNRHGCPAAGAPVPCEGIPPHPPGINKSPLISCGVYFCPTFQDFFNLVLPLYILSYLKYPISRILTYFAKNCDASLY